MNTRFDEANKVTMTLHSMECNINYNKNIC